jgi:phasin family protein
LLAAEPIEPVAPPVAELVEAAVARAEEPVAEVVEAPVETVAEVVSAPAETVAEIVEAPAPAVVETVAEPVAAIPPVKVEAPAFAQNVRTLVEKGLVETHAKFAQAHAAATEASAAVEASVGAARNGVVAFNVKAIEALKAGADANFDLVASLASAKSLSELVRLQSEFAAKRYEETTSHAKALAELARKTADEAFSPLKAQVAKVFKIAV